MRRPHGHSNVLGSEMGLRGSCLFLAVKSLPKRIESLAPLFGFDRRVGASLCSAMVPEEVLAPQQNFHLMYSGNTQPKKRGFPKAHRDITTTKPYQHTPTIGSMYEYEEPSSSESPCRAVAPVQQQPQNTKDNVGRPLLSPPRLEQREASAARRRGILVTKSEEPQSPAPPIGEIRIPVHPNYYMSISSPCSASLPNSTNQSTTDYESLYFSTVRDNHCLKQHLVYVSEENRTLKRHLIELQRRLFTARRNSSNRGQQQQQQRRRPEDGPPTTTTTTNTSSVNEDDVRGWSVPQSCHKRIKRDDSFTMSPTVSVPQSVSSEETVVLEG
jgi:hypothetical protein